MRRDQVPQDNAKAFMGHSKALYAADERGRLGLAGSNGWEAEEAVLDQAILEFERLAAEALDRARRGLGSPLEYHMFSRRMDLVLLADVSGFWRWQVRRHLRPGAFESLPPKQQRRYAEALGLDVDALKRLPEGA